MHTAAQPIGAHVANRLGLTLSGEEVSIGNMNGGATGYDRHPSVQSVVELQGNVQAVPGYS